MSRAEIARERVFDNLKVLAGDVEELVKATAEQTDDGVSSLRERIRETLETAKSTLTQGVRGRKMLKTSQQGAEAAMSFAQDNPWTIAGVATGASVLPIRVAGWQPDSLGHFAIYARSDQIIAGLERAVDPNDDGDAHDAARIALVALAEPFAAFADGYVRKCCASSRAEINLSARAAGQLAMAGDEVGVQVRFDQNRHGK